MGIGGQAVFGGAAGRRRDAGNGFLWNIVRYQCTTARNDHDGNIEGFPLWAGQAVGLVKRVQPAGEIVREIAEEAQRILKRLAQHSLS
jgi:NAD(P)H-dependent flavin oxidoreductase YrpB (nitropropane dioxygenase family)